MKKINPTVCLLCAVSMLMTACGDPNQSAVTVKIDAIGAEGQAVAAQAAALVEEYYAGMRDGSFERCMGVYPSFYAICERAWIDKNSDLDYDAFIAANHDYCKKTYGDPYTVTVTFDKLFQLTEQSVGKMEEILKESYDVTIDLTACYRLTATEMMSGSLKTEETELEWYLLCYDDMMYLYDTLYES